MVSSLSNLSRYTVLLASNSPRRKELLSGLDFPYEVCVMPNVDESYPEDLALNEVALFVSKKKSAAYQTSLRNDQLLITADTVVICDCEILGKPINQAEACLMLKRLSGRKHTVSTGVCITTSEKQVSFSVSTEVTFGVLEDEEIDYYVSRYNPLDKAGAYGIQEWIGFVGVESINGSYFNVMGLPIQRLYRELRRF